MVRSRIGSVPTGMRATAADHALPSRPDGLPVESVAESLAESVAENVVDSVLERSRGPLGFVFDVALPWLGDHARSIALGCFVALGGCDAASDAAMVEGIVRDGRTGAPIAGAEVTADDGHSVRTDEGGRFSMSAHAGDSLVANAGAECRGDSRLTIRLPEADSRDLRVTLWVRCAVPARGIDAAPSFDHAGALHDDRTRSAECATCHSGPAFVRSLSSSADSAGMTAPPSETVSPDDAAIDCSSCHDTSGPRGLRAHDTASAGSESVLHLGAGALCVRCHHTASREDGAAHASQADVLLGRGARSIEALEGGAHRFVADTCVRCHTTSPRDDGAHTFAIGPETCAPCHGGEVVPEDIGARDWNGDGRPGRIAAEHAQAVARIDQRLRSAITALAIRDTCGRVAADVIDHDARLHLVDASGVLLGDCDADDQLGAGELALTTLALPAPVADAAHDLAFLRRDRSLGVHNPEYTFRVLAALDRALH